MWEISGPRDRDMILQILAAIRDDKKLNVEIGAAINHNTLALRGEPQDVETLMTVFNDMVEIVPMPVGPLHVFPLFGKYRVMDRGAGNRILAPKFNTRAAAEMWAAKQVTS